MKLLDWEWSNDVEMRQQAVSHFTNPSPFICCFHSHNKNKHDASTCVRVCVCVCFRAPDNYRVKN